MGEQRSIKKIFEDCANDPACDPIEELVNLGLLDSVEDKDIGDSAGRMVDSITDLIREHNIGGQRGRDLADSVDRATGRSEREQRDRDDRGGD